MRCREAILFGCNDFVCERRKGHTQALDDRVHRHLANGVISFGATKIRWTFTWEDPQVAQMDTNLREIQKVGA